MEKQLEGIRNHFLSLLTSEYRSIYMTNNLESWPEISWNEFSDELFKQGINIELSAKRDWETLFFMEKETYHTIKREIMKLENIKDLREYLNLSSSDYK